WFDNSNDVQISNKEVKVEVDRLQSVDNSPLNYYTGPDYRSVIEAIHHVSNWEDLGLALQLDPSSIDAVKRSYNQIVEECRKEIIKKWMMTNDHPSWRSLCLALCTISVGHPNLAKSIGEMHPIKPAQQYNEPSDEEDSSQSAIPTPTTSTVSPSLPSHSILPPPLSPPNGPASILFKASGRS
uniref:Death domain-containing protein n=1 Tax=Amphimedon queenslandica TaxID=400682 RepID=A0A1X7SSQ0_AMPQE